MLGIATNRSGEGPATGNEVEFVVCNVIETRDGKIYREREYWDTLALMQQLGALPTNAAVA